MSSPTPLTPGDHVRTLIVGGRQRNYLVHVPSSYDGTRPVPVVLAFHGWCIKLVNFCGLDEKAEEAGFLAVFPNGTGPTEHFLTWNCGLWSDDIEDQSIDDVEFARSLLDDLASIATIDADRIYATGISSGAVMAYVLASELSDRVAAIASISGPMATNECHPKRPVSILHFHGTDDKFAPFNGGPGELSLFRTSVLSVEHTIGCWIKANGCSPDPVVTHEPMKVEDGTKVTRKTYSGGKNGTEVVLIEIEGGGHTWPGRKSFRLHLGKTTNNISANDAMWEFFEKHPRARQ